MARLSLDAWLAQQRAVTTATKDEFENTMNISVNIERDTDLDAIWKRLEMEMSNNPTKDIVITFINMDAHRTQRQ